MAPTPSIKITKNISFKGGTQQWSNRYHFDGGSPSDLTHWTTLATAIVTAEKGNYSSYIGYVDATCYDAGSDVPVAIIDFSTIAGTGTYTDSIQASEVVALCRYTTTARTSKNHPLYLFNYWHGVRVQNSSGPDFLSPAQKSSFQAYANMWIAGFSDGTTTHHRAGPNGQLATTALVETYVTHRDFR